MGARFEMIKAELAEGKNEFADEFEQKLIKLAMKETEVPADDASEKAKEVSEEL